MLDETSLTRWKWSWSKSWANNVEGCNKFNVMDLNFLLPSSFYNMKLTFWLYSKIFHYSLLLPHDYYAVKGKFQFMTACVLFGFSNIVLSMLIAEIICQSDITEIGLMGQETGAVRYSHRLDTNTFISSSIPFHIKCKLKVSHLKSQENYKKCSQSWKL